MTQRDYEQQPSAPDLGEVLHEDPAETLVGPPGTDPLDAGYVPPDRPYMLEDDAAQAGHDTLDERLRRERPDDTVAEAATTGGESDRAPRLEAAEPTPDTGYTGSTEATDAGLAGGAASAEEAAMHVEDEDGRSTDHTTAPEPTRLDGGD